jgi:hypothetical protein
MSLPLTGVLTITTRSEPMTAKDGGLKEVSYGS